MFTYMNNLTNPHIANLSPSQHDKFSEFQKFKICASNFEELEFVYLACAHGEQFLDWVSLSDFKAFLVDNFKFARVKLGKPENIQLSIDLLKASFPEGSWEISDLDSAISFEIYKK